MRSTAEAYMRRRTLLSSIAASTILAPAAARAAGNFVETNDGQRLFCRDVGRGRPVVLVHGWTLSSEIWQGQIDWLGTQGLRAVAYDRRGHGQSTKPETGYDYDRLAGDLATILDRLDVKDAVLVGHSMGAGEVVRYLARFGSQRIARVMLVAPTTPFALKTADNPEGVDRQIYDKIVAALQADRIGYLQSGTPNFIGTNPDPKVVDWAMTIALQASLQAEIQCLRAFSETDFRPDLKAITMPALIMFGTADSPIIPVNARRTHAAIAGSRLEIYDGAPHAVFLTNAERFNRDLATFAKS
jgi:pimeloyl-ACP methyl ester carboxylesterase